MSLTDKLQEEAKRQKERKAEQGDFEKVDWFKPKDGDNIIRIMPHWKIPEELFFVSVILHFSIEVPKQDGSGTIPIPVRCPANETPARKCPICELIDKANKEQKAFFKDVRPVERYLYNVFVAAEEKIKPYPAPLTVHQGIFEWIEEIPNPVDLDTGRAWKLVKEVDKTKSAAFGTKYKVRPSMNPSPFPSKFRELVRDMTDLSKLYGEKHDDALKRVAVSLAKKAGMIAVKDDIPYETGPKSDEFAEAPKQAASAPAKDEFGDAAPAKDSKPEFADDSPSEESSEELSPEDMGIQSSDAELNAELKALGIE